MGFIPAGGEFVAEAQRQGEFRSHRITSSAYQAPNNERQFISVGGDRTEMSRSSLQESRQAGERGLSELAERDRFIRLESLKPRSKSELMASARQRDAVLEGEEIARNVRSLPLLLPARPTCACGFDAALPPTTTAPTGMSQQESGNSCRRSAGRGFAGEEVSGARKSERGPY